MNRRITLFLLMLFIAGGASISPQTPSFSRNDPKEVVEKLWRIGARGELLSDDGWIQASKLFTKSDQLRNRDSIKVFSDYYGVNAVSLDGKTASVDMEYVDLGRIDSALRFKVAPPLPPHVLKTSMRYRLISGPGYNLMYAPDGRTLIEKKEIPGTVYWLIDDPPLTSWVTVNSAIRYVLETRSKASDATTRKNADETLAQLLRLH